MNVLTNPSRPDIEILVPGSSQILKNLGKRKILPPTSPKERALLIRSPGKFKKSFKDYFDQEYLDSINKQKELLKIKEILEKAVNRSRVREMESKTPTPLIRHATKFCPEKKKNSTNKFKLPGPFDYKSCIVILKTIEKKESPEERKYKDMNISTD